MLNIKTLLTNDQMKLPSLKIANNQESVKAENVKIKDNNPIKIGKIRFRWGTFIERLPLQHVININWRKRQSQLPNSKETSFGLGMINRTLLFLGESEHRILLR
ncbi:MAG: hypothetical protein IPL95_15540 [Saprospiraceae bacterium]|nr:hypothetical protein [Saprospiraceae bacterium]